MNPEISFPMTIDVTPDEEYPVRILEAYRRSCDVRWNTTGPSCVQANKDQQKRATVLDQALVQLKRATEVHTEKEHPPTLHVLCGLPGVGKTKWAKEHLKDHPDTVVIDIDCITAMLHGGVYTDYQRKFQPLYKAIEWDCIKNALLNGRDVIVDKVCHLRSTRVRFRELAQQLHARTTLVLFATASSPEELIDRRMENARGFSREHWTGVIKERAYQSDFADAESEGFDNAITVGNKMRQV